MKKASFSSTQWIMLAAMVVFAGMVGLVLPVLVGAIGDRYARLAALPVLAVLGLLFLFNRRMMFILIIILRASGDIVLNSTKGASGPGLGGAINAFILLIAFLYFVQDPKRVPREVMIPWLLLLGWYAVGVVISPDRGQAIRNTLGVCSYFAMFVCAFHVVRTPEDFRSMVKLVVLSSLLPAMFAVVNVAFGLRGGLGNFRLASTFSHANILAFYLILVVAMGMYMLKSTEFKLSGTQRFFLTGYLLYLLLLLLLTQTRSAWIACFFMFFLYAIFFDRRYLIYLAVLPLLVLLVPAVQDRIINSLTSGNGGYAYAKLNSFAWRVELWQSALHWMSKSRYLTGYGVESFPTYSPTFFALAGNTKWDAHNVYVQTFFELGAAGIALFLFLYYKVGRVIFRLYENNRLLTVLLLCQVVVYLLVSASDNLMYYLAFNWYFWFVAGMGCCLYYNSQADQVAGQRHARTGRVPSGQALRPV